MNDKELKSWKLIIQTLEQYGLYYLLQEEINDIKKCLERR